MTDKSSLVACISVALAGIGLSIVIHSPWSVPNIYSDIGSFWGRDWLASGRLPFVQPADFFEYPPISGFVLYLARILGGDYNGYYVVVSAMSALAAAALAWSTWRIAKMLGTRINALYFLLPGIIIYGLYSFDLFNTLFIMLSLQFLLERRGTYSAAALGLSIATKLVGVVLVPVFLLEIRDLRKGLKYLIVLSLALAIFYVPVLIANFNYINQFLSYFRTWGLEDAWYVWIYQDPSTWDYAKLFGLALTVVLLLRVYTLKLPPLQKSFLALSAYLLGTYIYAPQFSLMLIPFVAIMAFEDPSLFAWDVFNALIILTWFIGVGTTSWHPTLAGSVPQVMSLLRSAALAWMCMVVYLGRSINPFRSAGLLLNRMGGTPSDAKSGPMVLRESTCSVSVRLRPEGPQGSDRAN